jgi:hypothetical protein
MSDMSNIYIKTITCNSKKQKWYDVGLLSFMIICIILMQIGYRVVKIFGKRDLMWDKF